MAQRATEAELLDQLTADVEGFPAAVRALVDPLSAAQRLWRPGPERWSVADCFEHLLVTADQYHPRIRRALEEAARKRPPEASAAYRRRPGTTLVGRMLLAGVREKVGRPLPAPKVFAPPSIADPEAPEHFIARQEELLALLRDARGQDLHRTRLSTPVSRWLRLSVADALRVIVRHQRRHLGQARRVTEAAGFPAA